MRVALFIGLSVLSAAVLAETPATPAGVAQPVATVNGVAVPQSHYDLMLKQQFAGKSLNEAQRKSLIDALVLRELVVQQALKDGLDKDPDITSKLEDGRARLLATEWTQRWVDKHPITEEAVQKEYEAWKAAQSTQEYKLRHILVKEEAEAKALIEQLKQGGDFAKLAQEKSIDPSGKNGGDLGWATPDKLVGKIKDVVPTLTKGQFGPEPIQTPFGWHVMLVEDTRAAAVAELKDIRAKIEQKLKQQAVSQEFDRLRSGAKVE